MIHHVLNDLIIQIAYKRGSGEGTTGVVVIHAEADEGERGWHNNDRLKRGHLDRDHTLILTPPNTYQPPVLSNSSTAEPEGRWEAADETLEAKLG